MNGRRAEAAAVYGKVDHHIMSQLLRLIGPVVVLFLSLIAVVLPAVSVAADDPVAVTIHEGGDATTWGYTPSSTTIAAGQTVTWTNSGVFAHDAASTDGSWNTPLLNQGASASVTFSTAGTYAYICTPHPWMRGTIVVTQPVSTPPTVAAIEAPAATPAASPAPAADVSAPTTVTPADDSSTQPASDPAPDTNSDAGS